MPAIWMNHAATSWPKPPGVAERMRAALEAFPHEPGRSAGAGHRVDPAEACRGLLAELLRAPDPRRIALLPGATQALNTAIHGAVRTLERARRPVHCLTSTLEHNSVLRPLRHLAAEERIRLQFVGREEFEDPDALAARLRHGVDLAVLTACSNVTGARLDLEAAARECAAAEVVLVIDAAQAGGVIPLDVGRFPARSLLALAGHKGLLGPAGIGALWVGGGFSEDELPPLVTGGTGVRSDAPLHPAGWPLHFEAGTPNGPGIAGLAAGLEHVRRPGGVEEMGRARRRLAERLAARLEAIPEVRAHLPRSGDLTAGVLSFELDGWSPAEAAQILRGCYGVETRAGLHCAPLLARELGCPEGTVRASLGWSSTEWEVDALAEALEEIAGADGGRGAERGTGRAGAA